MSIEPPRPVLAVSCAVVRDGAVLLVKRAKAPALHRWAFPGGAVERGETMAEAVRRELMEETGLAIRPPRFVVHHEIIEPDGSHHYVIAVHAAEAADRSPPVAGDDAAEARFVAPRDLAGLDVTETTLDTLRMLGVLSAGAAADTQA